jgi:hypothetical protein
MRTDTWQKRALALIYEPILCLLIVLLPTNALCETYAQTVTPFHRDKATVASQYRAATRGLDPSKPLRWQFHWTATKRKRLTERADMLKTKEYVVIAEGKDSQGRFLLQLERIDILSADDLAVRSQIFSDGAKVSGQVYVGWSVAPL